MKHKQEPSEKLKIEVFSVEALRMVLIKKVLTESEDSLDKQKVPKDMSRVEGWMGIKEEFEGKKDFDQTKDSQLKYRKRH